MKLRCYCCGEPVEGQIALVTYSPDSADRVFVLKPEHLGRVDDTVHYQLVSRATSTAVPPSDIRDERDGDSHGD